MGSNTKKAINVVISLSVVCFSGLWVLFSLYAEVHFVPYMYLLIAAAGSISFLPPLRLSHVW